jgi:hypothetical protein
MNDKKPSVGGYINAQAVLPAGYVGPIVVGNPVKFTGTTDYEVTDDLAAGDKVVGEVFSLNGTAGTASCVIIVTFYCRAILARTSGAALAAGADVVFNAAEKVIPQVKTYTALTSPRPSRANIGLAGTVTVAGALRSTIGGVNVDTVLPVGTDPYEAALMVANAINADATVGPLARAWIGVAAKAEGGVARGSVGLAGTVTVAGNLRVTVDANDVDTALGVGDTPFEAAEMVANAINDDAAVSLLVMAFADSADADAIEGATAIGSVVLAVNATGGADLTITLDGTAVVIVPGAGEFPDAAASRMVDALNDTAALTDRFLFTLDVETPGTGGAATVRIWALNPGSQYNVALLAVSTDATMTAVASGAALAGGADITVATVRLVALQPGTEHNYALVSAAQAPLAGIVPTASGAALVGGTDDAAATVWLESRYLGAIANALALATSIPGALAGIVPTPSGALFTGGADDTKHDPLAVHGVAFNAAAGVNLTVYVGIY